MRGRTALGGGAADARGGGNPAVADGAGNIVSLRVHVQAYYNEELRDTLPASATEADARETEPSAATSMTRTHDGVEPAAGDIDALILPRPCLRCMTKTEKIMETNARIVILYR